MSARSDARVVVCGAINVDHVLDVEHLPAPGEGVQAVGEHEGFGGKGANAAAAAARMGAAVTLVARAGDDEAGERALAELAGEGIDVSAVGRDEAAATGHATVIVDAHGQNSIIVQRGANALLAADSVVGALGAVGPPAACLVSLEIPLDASLAAASTATAAGFVLIVDPAPPDRLPDGLLELGPILTPNEFEAEALTGEHCPHAAADALYSMTRQPVAITRGASGVIVRQRSGTEVVHSPTVLARDSTGAGDVFAGTLAVALAEGQPMSRCVRLAVAAAALSVTAPGARTSPSRSAAESFSEAIE